MMKFVKRSWWYLLGFFVACVILLNLGIMLFWGMGFIYNSTESLKPGIYKEIAKSPAVNDYIAFCPPDESIFNMARERGYLDQGRCNGKAVMLKKIMASKGDHVVINAEGVYVNNRLLPFSKPLKVDGANRPLQSYQADVIVPDGYVLTMTDYNPSSFDSRYYGLIPSSQVISVIKPFYTWSK